MAINKDDKKYQTNSYNSLSDKSNWVIPGLLVIIIILLIAVIVRANDRPGGLNNRPGRMGVMMHQERGLFGRGEGLNDNQSRLVGTVTAINGSNFTIAGNGSTNEVTTNSSTQYQNGSQVKVNDSVLVRGTTSNGTFTATSIAINP